MTAQVSNLIDQVPCHTLDAQMLSVLTSHVACLQSEGSLSCSNIGQRTVPSFCSAHLTGCSPDFRMLLELCQGRPQAAEGVEKQLGTQLLICADIIVMCQIYHKACQYTSTSILLQGTSAFSTQWPIHSMPQLPVAPDVLIDSLVDSAKIHS